MNKLNIPDAWLRRLYVLSDFMYVTMDKEEARWYAKRAGDQGQNLVLSCQELGIFGYQSKDAKHSTLFFTQTRGRMVCCFGEGLKEQIAGELRSLWHIKKIGHASEIDVVKDAKSWAAQEEISFRPRR